MVPCWIRYSERWEIADRKMLIVKMLLKTNTNGDKHPSISLYIIEQETIDETKENNNWHSTQEPRTLPKQSYRLWWGAASPILNDTPCVCIYATYNQNSDKECIHVCKYIYQHISQKQAFDLINIYLLPRSPFTANID